MVEPTMKFMDPKCDIAFKKLFGDKRYTEITISFLNAVLERTGDDEISSVTIMDPFNHPNADGMKTSAVDVRCVDRNGNQYIVEMQVVDKDNFIERSQYYTSVAIANQLSPGDDYKNVKPVIFVGVVSFDIDTNPHYLNHHRILNVTTKQCILRHMEFHYLELSKFLKTEAELVTIIDKWAYVFKQAESFNKIPEHFGNQPTIVHALELLDQHSWSTQEWEAYRKYKDAVNTERNLLNAGTRKGFVAGLAAGEHKKAQEIARGLLDVLDVATIARKTGLSESEVRALKREVQGATKTQEL